MSVYFLMGPLSFLQRISVSFGKAQLIGDWYENRRGALSTIILLIIRQYYWRTDAPCANRSGGPNTKKILLAHCARSALPIGGGGHRCANILAHRCTPRHYFWRTDPHCTPTLLMLERNTPSVFSISCNKFHIAYWWTKHFGAPCLFSSQLPVNRALQTGNGNTLRKRRRQH
jgi:hypothetical protein